MRLACKIIRRRGTHTHVCQSIPNGQGNNVTFRGHNVLSSTSSNRDIVINQSAKTSKLGTGMDRFSISNGSTLVEETNNRTNRTLNQSCSLNNRQIGDSIVGDSSDIAALTSFRQNQDIRSTQSTIGSSINEGSSTSSLSVRVGTESIVNIGHLDAKIDLSFLDHTTVIITAQMSSIGKH